MQHRQSSIHMQHRPEREGRPEREWRSGWRRVWRVAIETYYRDLLERLAREACYRDMDHGDLHQLRLPYSESDRHLALQRQDGSSSSR